MKPHRALLIEDDPSWQDILTELLEDCGFQVSHAGALQDALQTIRENTHRVAVVDLSLGGSDHRNQDGLKALDLLVQSDPECKNILLTGYATVELAVEVITEGRAVTCLRKENFSRSEFRELLGKARLSPPSEVVFSSEPPSLKGKALIVEDDAGWRSLLSELLQDSGLEARECSSFAEARTHLQRERFHLVIADLSLSSSLERDNQDGLAVLEVARKANIPAIVVSGKSPPALIDGVMQDGQAIGFFEKQAFDRKAFQALAENSLEPSELDVLTDREREVLDTLAQGLTNQQIAERLFISTNTVKRHLKSVFEKLGVGNRASAAALVTREKL
jgi:DNA-binding NarL/FixJ family response regulator